MPRRFTRCVICGVRPAHEGGTCGHCARSMNRERKREAARARQYVKYIVYRGTVAGLYHVDRDTLRAELVQRDPAKLPKGQTLDLDGWVAGFSREQVKRFKACIARLTDVQVPIFQGEHN